MKRPGWLSRFGESAFAPLAAADRAALGLVALAFAAGLLVFLAFPADPARLARFTPEQVALFQIADSMPQRRALLAFLGCILVGAVLLRFRPWTSLRFGTRWAVLLGMAALVLPIVQILTLVDALPLLPPDDRVHRALLMLGYAAATATFIAHRHVPSAALAVVIAAGLVLAWWPLQAGGMQRVSVPLMPMVDQHLAAVFSGGDMLAAGLRLFADIPTSYGLLTPLVIATAAKAGIVVDFLRLLHLVEFFQGLALCLFLACGWERSRGAPVRARLGVLLLILLCGVPFLSMSNFAVLLPNASGFRFVMFPLAVLCLGLLQRTPLVPATVLAGALAALAVLHNTETGIAITVGLGLAWLLVARDAGLRVALPALAAGLAAALCMLALPILLHLAATGAWLPLDVGRGMSLFRRFGEGFGGLALPFRLTALLIFLHAGYVLTRSLASLLGRPGPRPDIASAGIAAMIIVWAPYYANRPDDWNLWSFILLETLLLTPLIAAGVSRTVLAGLALLLLLPAPVLTARSNDFYLRSMLAMPVTKRCGAGLSIPPGACTEHHARAAELRGAAQPGGVLWITAYPYLTFQLTRLRPFIGPLDLYATALTEAELLALADRIRSAAPRVILIDGAAGTTIGDAVPAPMRALNRRIANLAGYTRCSAHRMVYWEVWMPAGGCEPS
ncbi:hypothetical protein [Plastoroseomonas arctica]|uniref:Uncharacterized protein n=1 Tax=Plastoroseomonas arctica TaxID=1509237 RepID=A0AAF1KJU1_9PROT|nr:hypothetical protein [Plastoroseomonas arctica]MBR0655830.1 hypothetical protein [Plastoroseomonas arctica]